ncbi:MAG TPA: FAD-dependent oxidoreductase, partial [Candidatus Methanofastidiosa archaeon]|nr:FAD-dependent oxidoreductase [Candidatus Methanofastidiosa archaeon]
FEEYYHKADKTGVKYVRARPAEVWENEDGDVIIRYEDTYTGEIKEEKFDLLVLSSAIVPAQSNAELSNSLGVELDENGFFKERDLISCPMESSRPGVFLSGCSQSPKDIPDSVAQGSAAAAMVMDILPKPVIKPVEQSPEKAIKADDEPKIGVFICMCGKNIAGYMDVNKLSEYALSLPNVKHAETLMFACSQDAQGKIKKAIKDNDLNRVVVAACTPRTHEALFQDTIREVGINKFLFEMANIRNQCSWVHSNDPEVALQKAKELVNMSVAKARLLESLDQGQIEVEESAMVIGGGVSGMSAALALAESGIKVYLVEKKDKLGGMLNELTTLYPSDIKAQDVVDKLADEISKNKNIDVMINTVIKNISGYIGNFEVELKEVDPMYKNFEEPFKVGTVIIATGAELIDPKGIY